MTQSLTTVRATRTRVLALATFAMMGATTAAAIFPADAATSECGASCISVFSSELSTYAHPDVVEAVLDGGAARTGQPVGLKPASGTDASEDFTPGSASNGGSTVADFYAVG